MRTLGCLFLTTALACYSQTATLTSEATPPEDPLVRSEAVRLMEQADRMSTPTVLPSNEQSIHLRVGQPDAGQPFEGDYTIDSGGPDQQREEWRYGTFSLVRVRNGDLSTTLHSEGMSSGFFPTIWKITPAWLGHFDREDVIRSIRDTGDGRRCIQFLTLFGDRRQQNEVCINGQNGWLDSIRIGDKTIRNSKYFAFNNAFLPGHVEQWVGDVMEISLDQTIATKEYPDGFFGAPRMGKRCAVTTRPSPIDTPQPAQQTASVNVVDIVLNGVVNSKGRVSSLKPMDNLHPDLNREALDLVGKWTYVPGTCDGRPVTEAIPEFTVHFKGR